MFKILKLFLVLSLAACLNLQAQEDVKSTEANSKEKNYLGYNDAFVLGMVEGITEFLPISSTGHLIIANHFLGLNATDPIYDSKGEIVLSKKLNEDGSPKAYTSKEAADAFSIIIQIAAIAAVAIIYWKEVFSMILGIFGRDKNGLMLARNLFVAFMPAAVIGFLLHEKIEELLFDVLPVIIALAVGAFAMIFIEKKYKKDPPKDGKVLELHELSIKQVLFVGFLQCIALWPGTSRSMMTILGAYIVGLRPVQAAKFSFLLGLITLSAASTYKLLKDGREMFEAFSVGPVLFGSFVAFVSSAIAAKWLVGFLNKNGLFCFAIYRWLLALVLILMFLLPKCL